MRAALLSLLVAAPALAQSVTYAYDDGAGNVNTGPPSSFDPDMLWGNAFVTAPGGETITEVAFALGPTFPSRPNGVTVWLLDDPDGDLDPRTGATAVASVRAFPDVSGDTLFRVALPPTTVSQSFFVGLSAPLDGGADRPARVDTGGRADRSWFFYAPSIAAVIDSLAAAPFGTRMDDPTYVPVPGAFMVRATGVPAGTVGADVEPETTAALSVVGAHPAPGAVTLRLALAAPAAARVDVFDTVGRRVAVLADGPREAGAHALRWRAPAPGVYLVRLLTGGTSWTLRVVIR